MWASRAIDREFGGKYRLRKSVQTPDETWLLEQKVGRASLEPRPILDKEGKVVPTDDWIRARDGYWFIMSVRDHERFPCSKCGRTLSVPILKTAEVKCQCGHRQVAAFYPLDGDALVQHLRIMDRESVKARMRELDRREAQRQDTLTRDHDRNIEAISREVFPQVVGIPQVGYTGREGQV